MAEADHYVEYYKSCIATAQRITFALAAFSIVAIYIGVIGNAAQRSEITAVEEQRRSLATQLSAFEAVLAEVRTFYEGPAEAESLNFASQIYAMNNTREFVAEMRHHGNDYNLNPMDGSFFAFQTTLIYNNAFELQNILGGLIFQKQKRVPFADLPFSDLMDLDYHKGKDAWQGYYEWSAMRYALYRKGDYGFSAYPEAMASLEKRYQYFVEKGEQSRGTSTKPKAAGRNQALVDQISAFLAQGFRSLGDITARLATLDRKIEDLRKSLSGSIKIPFLEQDIDIAALVWLVPLTIIFSLMFELYYICKARDALEKIRIVDNSIAESMISYPWIMLNRPILQQKGYGILIICLRGLIVVAPIAISAVLGVTTAKTSLLFASGGGLLTIAAGLLTIAVVKEVRRFSAAVANVP